MNQLISPFTRVGLVDYSTYSTSESDNEPIGLNPGKFSVAYSDDCLNDVLPVDRVHCKKYFNPAIKKLNVSNGGNFSIDSSVLDITR